MLWRSAIRNGVGGGHMLKEDLLGWPVLECACGALIKHQRRSQEEHETTTDSSKHRGKAISTPKAEGKILRPCGSR